MGEMTILSLSPIIVQANQVIFLVRAVKREIYSFLASWKRTQRINQYSKRVSLRCSVSAVNCKNKLSKRETKFTTVTTTIPVALVLALWNTQIHQNKVTLKVQLFVLGLRLPNLIWWATIIKSSKRAIIPYNGGVHITWRLYLLWNLGIPWEEIWNLRSRHN